MEPAFGKVRLRSPMVAPLPEPAAESWFLTSAARLPARWWLA